MRFCLHRLDAAPRAVGVARDVVRAKVTALEGHVERARVSLLVEGARARTEPDASAERRIAHVGNGPPELRNAVARNRPSGIDDVPVRNARSATKANVPEPH